MTGRGDHLLREDAERVLDAVSLDPLRGRRVLLTGASGLLGTHLLAALGLARERGVEAPIDAVVRGDPPAHLAPLLARCGAHLLRGDLTDAGFRASLPHADVVVHGACYAQPSLFMADPVGTLSLGTEATLDLLRRVKPGGSFLFLGSSEVYSGLTATPFREDQIGSTTPAHPRACYIEAKRAGEAACHAFRTRGVDAKVARVSLAYGPGTRPGDQRVLSNFIESALTRGEIRTRDAGRAMRTYAYATDVAELLFRILLSGREAVYNVGGVSTISIAGLAREVGVLAGVPVAIPEEGAGIAGAPEDVRLDLSRTRDELGKTEYVPLSEGLARTIAWHRALAT